MAEIITLQHLRKVIDYVEKTGAITNRECRDVTGLSYDSSIKIFSALGTLGLLRKTGTASATKYVAPLPQRSQPRQPGFHRKIQP